MAAVIEVKNFSGTNIGIYRRKIVEGGYIVLATWLKGGLIEFITWFENTEGALSGGHYFLTYEAALKDYQKR